MQSFFRFVSPPEILHVVVDDPLSFLCSQASAFSASVVYRILYNLWNISTVPHPFLYDEIHSYFSQGTTSSTQAPLPSSPPYCPPPSFDSSFSPVLRTNVYWFTSLVFSVSAVTLAMLGKQVLRSHRDRLQAVLRRRPMGAMIPSVLSYEPPFLPTAIDAMYRLFQVALVLIFLAHVDAMVISVGVTVLAPIVVFGLLYVFGIIGPPTF